MKKKSLFNGISAKMALAVVALSGALLTGCYKDDGLDASKPLENITLPDATYTVVVSVANPEGDLVSGATVTVGGQTATGSGVYTAITKTPGATTITVTPPSGDKYVQTPVTRTLNIQQVNAGQAVVYNQVIMLPFVEVTPTPQVELKFDLSFDVYGADDLSVILPATEYTATLVPGGSNFENLTFGAYTLVVTPADTDKYETYTSQFGLERFLVDEGTANLTLELPIVLSLVEPGYVYNSYSACFATINGATISDIALLKDGVEIPSMFAGNNMYGVDKVLEGQTYTYSVSVNWTNSFGQALTEVFEYAEGENVYVATLDGGSTSMKDGLHIYDDEGDGDIVLNPNNASAYLNGKEIDIVTISRSKEIEATDLTILRAYKGAPKGTVFTVDGQDNYIAIEFLSFAADFGDNVKFVYADGSEGGKVVPVANAYQMQIPHFSRFYAQIEFKGEKMMDSGSSISSKVTEVNKSNNNDSSIDITINYKYPVGTSVDIEGSVKEAFPAATDATITRVVKLIQKYFTDNQIGFTNTGISYEDASMPYVVAPYTCVESVTVTTELAVELYAFDVAGTTVVVEIERGDKATVSVGEYYFGHGHSHGHGHGHGGDLSGGGIIDAE